ncbi:MAG TPA: FHA domain-containing protein, partial [Gemmataceae bacterium]|nr:FHA domain-containing protein [Gemmataceae bacterium]
AAKRMGTHTMSFRLFIYYCAICGGWAAFATWCILEATGWRGRVNHYLWATLTGALLGSIVAAAIGAVDALLNAVGTQRLVRVGICLGIGLFGGMFGGVIGEFLHSTLPFPVFFGWILTGICIGASIGIYDLLRSWLTQGDTRVPLKRTLNGVYGGLLGGFLGGLPFGFLMESRAIPRSNLAISLVVLGLCIGLLIGLAQVFLKDAWLKVAQGFRPGRELLLAKDETTIGRAESCDLGLFGDNTIERLHARILLQNQRYLLADADTSGGTFLNEERITEPTPLKSGDKIRVGNSVIEFGERQKRKNG